MKFYNYIILILLFMPLVSPASYFGYDIPQKDLSNEQMMELLEPSINSTGGSISDEQKSNLFLFALTVLFLAGILLWIAFKIWEDTGAQP